MKASLKSMKNLENKGALQETPCIYDEKPPNDVRNPYLQGENKALHVGRQTSKKSLKMMLVSV